jgi:hypothetical protein
MTQHTVQRGETLTSIAARYSVDVQELQTKNNILNPKYLQQGQRLIIPSSRKSRTSSAKSEPIGSKNKSGAASASGRQNKEQDGAILKFDWISFQWLEELLQKLRSHEADEHVQKTEKTELTPQEKGKKVNQEPARKTSSKGSQKVTEVKQKIKETLNKEPHVITFNGVRLTENEKKQILAAVACCEMNADGFGSINSDTEFTGRKFGARGIETSYSRIVHIGLSYGIIQYTQDSGSLGRLLKKMRDKNLSRFVQIFGGGEKSIADSLITLTTTGRPDLEQVASVPLSGQTHWNKIRKTPEGKDLKKLSTQDKDEDGKSDLPTSREIRGKRVQPIPATEGGAPIDIWTGVWKQRFLEAGSELDFQEIQLKFGVENYLDPILSLARRNNVRSALGLAFVTACTVRGGVGSDLKNLLFEVAKELNITLPFKTSDDEARCVKAIADSSGRIGRVEFDPDEAKRAKRLISDELGFLAEDLYDLSTYEI